MQAYKQFGNSVAVPVIKAIASNMLKAIKVSTDDMAT
jgi:site-specific DNA-cytosine methylase